MAVGAVLGMVVAELLAQPATQLQADGRLHGRALSAAISHRCDSVGGPGVSVSNQLRTTN